MSLPAQPQLESVEDKALQFLLMSAVVLTDVVAYACLQQCVDDPALYSPPVSEPWVCKEY